ncbi:hypothetical protein NC653_022689 [Populus alba x Populus x berolinensis]|uniref:Serine/arginine repetitive matrix protein 1-like n=1 Tax=Populus alba x Populus x berolinensis TaxID=444605 RepID=A0AAD6Q9R7_9ROSI|nr:hypothetical protein NC653_022689 [Populus alba x Populus x berolinensis]
MRRRSPLPLRRRTPSPVSRRSPSPRRRRSPPSLRRRSPSPHRSPSPVKSPKEHRSPVQSPGERVRLQQKLLPIPRRSSNSLRSPQRDQKDRKDLCNRFCQAYYTPSPGEGPHSGRIPPVGQERVPAQRTRRREYIQVMNEEIESASNTNLRLRLRKKALESLKATKGNQSLNLLQAYEY